jgi:hypothetical protein
MACVWARVRISLMLELAAGREPPVTTQLSHKTRLSSAQSG